MRALSKNGVVSVLAGLGLLGAWPVSGATLQNPDFETGDFSGWATTSDMLTLSVSTNDTFNRNHAARLHGSYAADRWITNTISQSVPVKAGDSLNAVGFIYWKDYAAESPAGDAFVRAHLDGPFDSPPHIWTTTGVGWVFFELGAWFFGVGNGGFESGSLSPWTIGADHLSVTLSRDVVCEGNYSMKMAGEWDGGWSFNQAMQGLMLEAGDIVKATAKVNVKNLQATAGYAVAGIKLESETTGFAREAAVYASTNDTGWLDLALDAVITNDGYYVFRCLVAGDVETGSLTGEVYFDDVRVWKKPVEADNGGFETGDFSNWYLGADDLDLGVTNTVVDEGEWSVRMLGTWSNWSFNQVVQPVHLHAGDVVEARGRVYLDTLEKRAGYVVAGIKLESTTGGGAYEHSYDHTATKDQWLDLGLTAIITNGGWYDFRAMVCGDTGIGGATADVYFDSLRLWKQGGHTGNVDEATLMLDFCGYSGGTGSTSSVDLYYDSLTLSGSSANPEPADAIFTVLRGEAAAIAADPAEDDIPEVIYPPLNAYGYPRDETNDVVYPSYAEMTVAGWRFRYLTNDVVLSVTNTIQCYAYTPEEPLSHIEFDQYFSCAKFWHTPRGTAGEVRTNGPYFSLGVQDGSGAEFGDGPFPAEVTYVVGASLTGFPRKLSTSYDGYWPVKVHVVYPENFADYDRNWDKYFVISVVPTNARGKVIISLACTDPGHTNLAYISDQFIHLGPATREEPYGLIDFPNCTYQDHNQVFLRASWLYGLVDQGGWFMQQVPRGSATIEPLDLYALRDGGWLQKMYEEYLFTWPNSASGVRSIFEDDYTDRVPGPGSYSVGFKIGHQRGTNEFGEPLFPGVMEVRGNGYYRMTDYDGVMGGSFRPVAADIFGIYQDKEDAPIMPAAYTRLVARSTPTSQLENAYAQFFMPVRSKTNGWFAGAVKVDAHFAPDEAEAEGAYFEVESDVYANRAVVREEHGKLNVFAQVDMYWRGSAGVDEHVEGHDFDAVVIKKADGEWVTHRPVNPPTNIYHRTLASFRSNDVLYLMQQDRGPHSYEFDTEAPYRKVSTFEFTMLDDGGRNLALELYEQNTISEINDNVVAACAVDEDLAQGEHVQCRYRYRSIYAPGVTIIRPNEPAGGESWSGRYCTIEFYATDGDDRPLQADIFYGNGTDEDWMLINTGELLLVPTNTHRVTYDWDASSVPPGAYYIKVEAQPVGGGKTGFDVSDGRLQLGSLHGFINNGSTNVTVVTNHFAYLGTNMSFETGDVSGWAAGADHLDIHATTLRAYAGLYSARMWGPGWTNWSWNNVQQEVPCRSGEVLHVSGRVFIAGLSRAGTNWLACGIKMEATNDWTNQQGVEFKEDITTGVWLNVEFERTAPVDGTDRILLWVAGYDCADADVFFDDLRVVTTNTDTVITNRVRQGYWEGDQPADVGRQNALSFWLAATQAVGAVNVWVADANSVTSAVPVTNYIDRVFSLPQRVDVPWADFAGVDRSNVLAIGFAADAHEVEASSVRSIETPLRVRTRFTAAPLADFEGMPHYNPGQDVIEEITIQNVTTAALSGVTVQLLQEYGETTTWLDISHKTPLWSEKAWRGDRLCGGFETVLTNQAIPAGGSLTITNVYRMPAGRLIDHTRFAIPSQADWYIFRNYAARAQVHLVVRQPDGYALYDNDQVGCYSMDDDYDIDNDGLPDYWEILHGGDYASMLPDGDPDHDGYGNLAEYQAGSDPNDPYSYPGHLTTYTLHLAYTNGDDLFPRAIAEATNFTGAASCWMIASYLHETDFPQTQQEIYDGNTHDTNHCGEITPQSCAAWMYANAPPQYYFSARSRTNLESALKETVYWMDYLPPGGKKTPVYILCDTKWSYKVVRGFQTDRPPYDGGYGVTTSSTYTIYGVWLNDPGMNGLGYDVYATAEEMDGIYLPSENDGRRWLVAEPPRDEEELTRAIETIDESTVRLAAGDANPALAEYLGGLFGETADEPDLLRRGGLEEDMQEIPDLYSALPPALRQDEGFMGVFDDVHATNFYAVNAGSPEAYVLGAGGVLGPASTVYALKLGTNGAFQQATWNAGASLYPPVSLEAAEWAARRELGLASGRGNLLANGSFEINTGEAGSAASWAQGGAAGTYDWAWRSGSWGMGVAQWVGNSGYFYQDYAADVSGTGFTFSMWLAKDDTFTPGTVELKLEWFDEGMAPLGTAVRDVAADVTNSFGWFSVAGTAPSGTRTVRCTVWCGDVTGTGALKCDDAELVATTNAAVLVEANLVYEPGIDPSPFMPRWHLVFCTSETLVTNEVPQDYDLGGDADLDGMSDGRELYAGTDPENAASVVGMDIGRTGAQGDWIVLTWESATGKRYSLLRSTNLAERFSFMASHIAATPPVNEYTNELPAATTYYRLEVE
ncbi:MAG: glucan biosynthesis protein [Kiritimatiellae bacterium]|nr:glucan biosynthesis protein [Kiritimatiellia bacterium]